MFSAWESSFSEEGPFLGRQLSTLFGLNLSIALCTWTMHRLRRLSEEKKLKRSDFNIPGPVWEVLTFSVFVDNVDAESFLTSRSDGWRAQIGCGCSGSRSCCHRNFSPLSQRLLCSSSFAVKPRVASSAGFSFPGTCNQSPGELRSLICCTRLLTYTWNRWASLLR